MEPRPFTVAVSDEELAYLKQRLESARELPDQLTDIAAWEDGTDKAYFKDFLEYWKNGYDWRKWEAKLNEFKQFKLEVNGIDLHFVHERSADANAMPLLLLHGWPGSYFEFYKLIPQLKARYHIVAPSLPGYGFSSAPTHRGFGATSIAKTVDALMAALGYDRYIAQGGDWGAIVCRALAKFHSDRCAAVHVNMCVAMPQFTNPWHVAQCMNIFLAPSLPLLMSAQDMRNVKEMRDFMKKEAAYQKIQGTKPQTLAYALHDSPVGLAAWILEKLKTWSDCGGVPDAAISRDEMLTDISIYWFGGRIASSMRLYKETLANSTERNKLWKGYVSTPAGVAIFPREIFRPPRNWAASIWNIQQWTEMPHGGHFAALEQPELLAREVLAFGDLVEQKGWLRAKGQGPSA